LNLIVVEIAAVGLLFGDPVFKTLADRFGEGFELPFLADGEFHQGDEVGQDTLLRGVNTGAVEGLVGAPERLGGPGNGRFPTHGRDP
jgi:hypothetical protein